MTHDNNTKFGDIKKCPACGAVVSPTMAKCPECGYEFSNISANATSTKLLAYLNDIDIQCSNIQNGSTIALQRKNQAIRNFPIPNTKEDLIEMLTLCHANSSGKGESKGLSNAWKAKTEQVVAKAKVILGNDKDAVAIIHDIETKKKKGKKRKLLFAIVAILIIAIATIFFIISQANSQSEIVEKKNAIIQLQSDINLAIQQDTIELAYSLLDSLKAEISLQEKDSEFAELTGEAYLKIVISLLRRDELQDAATVGLEYRDKLNNPSQWHDSQIYKLLKQVTILLACKNAYF